MCLSHVQVRLCQLYTWYVRLCIVVTSREWSQSKAPRQFLCNGVWTPSCRWGILEVWVWSFSWFHWMFPAFFFNVLEKKNWHLKIKNSHCNWRHLCLVIEQSNNSYVLNKIQFCGQEKSSVFTFKGNKIKKLITTNENE